MVLTSVPNAARVWVAALLFLAQCAVRDVTPAVRISAQTLVQFAAQFAAQFAVQLAAAGRAESPLASPDVGLVVKPAPLFPVPDLGSEFPDAVTPPVVQRPVRVD